LTEGKEAKRKAVEIFISGKKNPGKEEPWEEPRKPLSKEERDKMESLVAPTSTKGLKVRGRKIGKVTPRQTFRCDESLWRSFQKATRKKESKSASEILRRFIYSYVHR